MSGNSLSNRIRKRRPFKEQPFINNLICPTFIRMSKEGFFKPCAYCEIKKVYDDVMTFSRIVSCPFGAQVYNEEPGDGNELYLQRSRDV